MSDEMKMVKSVTLTAMPGSPTVKLGMVSPKAPPKVLRLKNFLLGPVSAPIPNATDYTTKARDSLNRMYLNDRKGCCVISGKAHDLGVWSANDGRPTVTLTDQQIAQLYAKLAVVPGQDTGCIITDVLDYMSAYGFPDDKGNTHKIDGYVGCDTANRDEIRTAVYLFGSLSIGFAVTNAMVNKAREGAVWTAADFNQWDIAGGHDVSIVGYDSNGVKVSTWGVVLTMTWDVFGNPKCVSECYAKLAPLWYGDDKINASTNLDLAALKKAIDQLKGGIVPPIPDPVSPPPVVPPPVVPPPPVPPTPVVVVSDVVLTGQIPGMFGSHTITLRGTSTPRTTAVPVGWPNLADVQKLCEDVFALVQSGEAATVETAVLTLIPQIRAGQYGLALMTIVATIPAITVLVQRLTAIIMEFRTHFSVVTGATPAGNAFTDWLAAHADDLIKLIQDLLALGGK